MHKGLNELPLEQQKGDQQRSDGHQGGRGDNRPVHAGFRGAKDTQANRQGAGFHRVGHDQGPQEIVSNLLKEIVISVSLQTDRMKALTK